MPDVTRRRTALRRVLDSLYIDTGTPDDVTLVSGLGRSGTTWIARIINHDHRSRIVFEPFRPRIVRDAGTLGDFPYVRREDRDRRRLEAAGRILGGQTPRGTLDRQHRGWLFRDRIVKAIRSNLMLGWLRALRPSMPIVFVIRNPFAVAASWMRLGWGGATASSEHELHAILKQDELRHDFPELEEAARGIDQRDPYERIILQWGITHLVPLRQLGAGEAHVVFYEHVIVDPEPTIARLAHYLNRRLSGPSVASALRGNTETDFLGRGDRADRKALLGEFREVLTAEQIERGRQILSSIGLDMLYGATGLPRDGAGGAYPVLASSR